MRWSEEEYAAYVARRRAGDGDTAGDTAGDEGIAPTPEYEASRRGDALIARGTHPRPTKYGNRRTEVDGKKFDSKHEAEVYQELMLRVRAGELKCVARQVAFDLPGGIRYVADFVTIDADDRVEVIDAKSPATLKNRVYINKRKQMASEWGIEIREV